MFASGVHGPFRTRTFYATIFDYTVLLHSLQLTGSYALLIQSQAPESDCEPFVVRLGRLWRIKNWQN